MEIMPTARQPQILFNKKKGKKDAVEFGELHIRKML